MSSKNEDILQAWSELIVSHALAVREVEAEIAGKAPLSLDEYDILLVISRAPNQRLRFSALAEETIYTRSGITRITGRLEKRNYLSRQQCPEDARGFFAVLTDQGKQALKDTWKFYGAAVVRTFGEIFNQSEAKELAALLAKIIDQLKKDSLVQIKGQKTH